MFLLLANFIPQVRRQKLIEKVIIGMILSGIFCVSNGNYFLREQIRLNSPILTQFHDDILNEELIVVEEFCFVSVE